MGTVSGRARLARQVFRAIQHPDFKAAMPRRKNGQPLPILLAESTDRIGATFDEADRIGSRLALVVAEGRKTFSVLDLARAPSKAPTLEHAEDCLLHPDVELGMLLVFLREVEPVTRCRFLSPGRKVKLVDDGNVLT